jgi:hypothetical protein
LETSGAAQAVTILNSGNVGIGTTGPSNKLHVLGSGSTYIQIGDGTNNAYAGIEGGDAKLISTGHGVALRTDGGGWSDKLYVTNAGNVGIGTTSPNAAAILHLNSTTKGFLPPQMTTTQRDAISSPPEGLLIWNTTTKALNVYDGTSWRAINMT